MELSSREEAVSIVLQRDPRTLWRRSGSKVVLAVADHHDLVILEGAAALTWGLLGVPVSERDLISSVAAHFDVETQQVGEQLAPFLENLRELGAVNAS